MSSAFDSVGDGELTERSAADQKAQQQRADERNSIFRQFSRGIYFMPFCYHAAVTRVA